MYTDRQGPYSETSFSLISLPLKIFFILVTVSPAQLLSIAVVALKATSAKLDLKGTELTARYTLKLLTVNCLMFMRILQNFNIMNMQLGKWND